MTPPNAPEPKFGKAHGREMEWFDVYLEMKNELEERIWKLEQRVKALESDMRNRGPK